MPRDELFIMPYGCLECGSIIPHMESDVCPRCGSLEILSIDAVLQKAIEYEVFMQDMGFDNLRDND